MKTCPECELEFESESCTECERARQFIELENLSLRLEDDLSDRLSDLYWAKQNVQKFEDAVNEVRSKLRQNEIAMNKFEW